MLVACAAHLEDAIDDFVIKYETAPDVHRVGTPAASGRTIPATCAYCGSAPEYMVVQNESNDPGRRPE